MDSSKPIIKKENLPKLKARVEDLVLRKISQIKANERDSDPES